MTIMYLLDEAQLVEQAADDPEGFGSFLMALANATKDTAFCMNTAEALLLLDQSGASDINENDWKQLHTFLKQLADAIEMVGQ